ncbi:porin family protein, partial [Bacteroidota bacterium]
VLIAIVFGDKLNTPNVEFGINVGMNYSTLINTSNSEMKLGLNIGPFFNIRISDRFSFYPSVLPVLNVGTDNFPTYETGYTDLDDNLDLFDVTRKMSYISVPLLFKYRIFNQVYFEAGPQVSLLKKARDIFHSDDIGDGLTYENVITEELKQLDLGMASGLSYRLSKGEGLGIGVRYTIGFIDTLKNNDGKSQNNSIFSINFSIPVKGKDISAQN